MLSRFKFLAALVALSSNFALADAVDVTFTLAGSSSLTSADGNPAIGNAIASLVQTNTGSQATITGGVFDFVSGARDGAGGALQSFFAGGSWSIFGKVIAAGITVDNTLLAQGVFTGNPGLINIGSTNIFNGNINVSYVDPLLLTYLSLQTIVPNTQSMSLQRTGNFAAGNFTDSTSTGPTNTEGSLTLQALSSVPEPSSVALFGLGFASLAYLRRFRRN